MARHDVFVSESHTPTTHRNNTGTTTGGAVTLAAGGATFVVSAAPTLAFVEGQIVALTGSGKTAYCRISRVQSSTTLTLLPLQSAIDTAGAVGASFPNGSTITSSIATPVRAATVVVDLTEAPFASASYLIAACGNFTTGTASATVGACLRVSALVGDPYSGTGRDTSTGLGPSQTSVTWGTSVDELAPYMGATTVALSGGQRYEFAIEFWSATSNATATFDEAAIVAVRCDTVYASASTAETTTASTTAVNQYTLPTLPAGRYLVTATWALGVSNTAYDVIADVDTGIAGLATVRSRLTLRSTSDYVSCGQMFVLDVPATNAVALQLYSSSASGTAKMRNATIAAVLVPRAFDLGYVATPDNVTTAVTTATDTNLTVQTGSATLARSGRTIQVVSSDVGTTTSSRIRWRATTSAGTNTPIAHGMVWGTASTSRHSTFFLYRQSLSSGSNAISLLGRSTNVPSTTLTARTTSLSWLLERADLAILPTTPTSIVVDMENGGLLLKTWSASGSAFRKHLPMATGISRVLGPSSTVGGGVEYGKVASVASLTSSGTWYWDAAAQDIYVYLSGGGTPGDASKQVVVIPQLLVGRDHEDLISDDDGVTYLPYEPRIDTVPGMTQELAASDGRFEVATSLGSLTLATADGLLDDQLVQNYYDGIRARVRRGWSTLSNRIGDFEVIADALIGMPDTDFQSVTLKLFDRGMNIAKPVATAQVTVNEGNAADTSATTRDGQSVPVIYGTVKRVQAYRVSATSGATSYNLYQIAAPTNHSLSSVTAVYLDPTTKKVVATGSVDSDSAGTYRNAGQVRIKNDAFADATKPADTVYVDVVGRTTSPTSYSATALTTPGAIARDLLTTYGGLAATDLIEPSFRLLDRAWRKQLTSSTFVPTAPSIGLLIEGDEDVWTALLRLCGDVGAFPYVSRQGRIGIGVVDMDAPTLLDNGGFEFGDAVDWVRSWTAGSVATIKVSSSRRYEGTYSLEASNGGTPNSLARIEQSVVLPTPGSYVLSCFASSLGGETAAFRLACYLPDGTEALSDPFVLSSLKWTRCTFAFDTAVGSAGSAKVRIYPAYGSTTATSVAVDNAELLPVAFVGDDGNTLASSLEFREETFYEVAVSYDVNTQDPDNASKLVLTDGEARGLSASVQESKYAAQSAKRLDLGLPLCKDSASAAGIGAALLTWFGRTRHVLTLEAMSLTRIPNVGERVYLRNLVQLVKNDAGDVLQRRHIPELADAYPFWLITEVSYEGDNAQIVSLKLERQQDPVVDRTEMSPEAIPMGAIGLATSSSAVVDFADYSALAGYYIRAYAEPDVVTERGSATHQHDLSHTHTIPSHQHATALSAVGQATRGLIGEGPYDYWIVGGGDYPSYNNIYFGPAFLFTAATLAHSHTLSGSSVNVGMSSVSTASVPVSTLLSRPGSNEPSHARVRFMQRTASTLGTIDPNLVIGYESASIPAGWTRVTALDGRFVKGATSNGTVATTVATSTSFAPSDSGSTLTVTSATGITVGKLLRVGTSPCVRVVVTAISGTALTVVPVWEAGDTSTTYAAATAVTGSSEVVGQAYDPLTHDHAAVMPAHAHTGGGHTHGTSSSYHTATAATPITARVSVQQADPQNQPRVTGAHQHRIYPQAAADTTVSASAGGTVSAATTPAPDAYSVVWIRPTAAGLTVVPTGSLMLWAVGSEPPVGWQVATAANRLLLRGADTGQGASSTTSGHSHTMTPASHGFAHQHGGTSSTYADDVDGAFGTPDFGNGTPTVSAAAAPESGTRGRKGHTHLTSYSVAATDPGLDSAAAQPTETISGTPSHPLHKRLILIRKV